MKKVFGLIVMLVALFAAAYAYAGSCTPGMTVAGKVCIIKGDCKVGGGDALFGRIYNSTATLSPTATTVDSSMNAVGGITPYAITNIAMYNGGAANSAWINGDAWNQGNQTMDSAGVAIAVFDNTVGYKPVIFINCPTSFQATGGPLTSGAWSYIINGI
jgi:hypothetical protein